MDEQIERRRASGHQTNTSGGKRASYLLDLFTYDLALVQHEFVNQQYNRGIDGDSGARPEVQRCRYLRNIGKSSWDDDGRIYEHLGPAKWKSHFGTFCFWSLERGDRAGRKALTQPVVRSILMVVVVGAS